MSLSKYPLNPDFADIGELQRYLNDIAARLVRAEGQQGEIDAAIRTLLEFGLLRIDENLRPALERINAASEFGFLVATSASPLTLTAGEAVFEVTEGGARDLFTPTPTLTIMRAAEGAESQYAVARLVSYDKETGGLVVDVQAISGMAGEHNDWVIASSSGLAPAVITLAAQVYADKAAVAGDRAAVVLLRAAVADDKDGTLVIRNNAAQQVGLAGEQVALAHAEAVAAAQSALAAQTWDPSSYYNKDVTDEKIGDLLPLSGGIMTGPIAFAEDQPGLGDTTETGRIVRSHGALAAPEWLPCDGAAYLQSAYPDLFAAMGHDWADYGEAVVSAWPANLAGGNTNSVTEANGNIVVVSNVVAGPTTSQYAYSSDGGASWNLGALNNPRFRFIFYYPPTGKYIGFPYQPARGDTPSRRTYLADSLAGPWAGSGYVPDPPIATNYIPNAWSIKGEEIAVGCSKDGHTYYTTDGAAWGATAAETGTGTGILAIANDGTNWIVLMGSHNKVYSGTSITSLSLLVPADVSQFQACNSLHYDAATQTWVITKSAAGNSIYVAENGLDFVTRGLSERVAAVAGCVDGRWIFSPEAAALDGGYFSDDLRYLRPSSQALLESPTSSNVGYLADGRIISASVSINVRNWIADPATEFCAPLIRDAVPHYIRSGL